MRQKFISVFLCFALSFLVLSPSYLAPKKAHAIAPAIPIAIAVGAVVASGLAAYGIQSVNNGRSVEDVGSSFISWISSKDLDDFWDAQTDIKSAQAAINSLYQIGLDGSMSLADWTYNEQNAIYGVYGALMQLWAADGFAASGSVVSGSTATVGDFSFSTYYSDVSFTSITGQQFYDYPPIAYIVTDSDILFIGRSNSSSTAPYYKYGLALASDGVNWALGNNGGNITSGVPSDNIAFSGAGRFSFYTSTGQAVWLNSANSSSPLYNVPISSLHFNTYYDFYIKSNAWSGSSSQSIASFSGSSAGASYDASLDLWSGDVSIDTGIEGSLFDKFSDALSKGINDLLSQEIPVASDMVYNPSTQALESQGSIPVTLDWSNVLDWADVLNGTRAGTLDGSQSIDGTTSTTAVNTASGTLSTDIALDTALDTPYLSITPNIGSIGGAMGYAGGQMLDKFPFCTIRDLQALADFMNSPAQAPYFDLPLVVVDNGSLDVVIQRVSLAQWEPVAVVLRFMIGLLIILGFLRVATRQLKIFNEE